MFAWTPSDTLMSKETTFRCLVGSDPVKNLLCWLSIAILNAFRTVQCFTRNAKLVGNNSEDEEQHAEKTYVVWAQMNQPDARIVLWIYQMLIEAFLPTELLFVNVIFECSLRSKSTTCKMVWHHRRASTSNYVNTHYKSVYCSVNSWTWHLPPQILCLRLNYNRMCFVFVSSVNYVRAYCRCFLLHSSLFVQWKRHGLYSPPNRDRKSLAV